MIGAKLSDLNFRDNSIGFLRLFFAAIVIWSHTYDIGAFGFDPITWYTHGSQTAGTLAVAGFFVLSGFLITRSYETIGRLGRFLWHRFVRIFPGYWVCLVVTAFAIAPLAYFHQHGTLQGFLTLEPGPLAYVISNFGLITNQISIGNIVAGLNESHSLNGSIWTLQVEFSCYGVVGILGCFAVLSRRRWALLAAALVLQAVLLAFDTRSDSSTYFSPLTALESSVYFLIGSCAYLYRQNIPMNFQLVVACLAASVICLPLAVADLVVPWCLSYVVLFVAMKWGPRSFDRRMDLSYGTYVYAFPIQQLLVIYGVNRLGFAPYLAVTITATLMLAGASWFLIERPSLSLKNVRSPWSGPITPLEPASSAPASATTPP